MVSHRGRRVFIARMVFISEGSGLNFTLRHRQLPLRLAFAMTVNRSQGQTFRKVGLELPNDLFSHGQLYVALSRSAQRTALWFWQRRDSTMACRVFTPRFLCTRSLGVEPKIEYCIDLCVQLKKLNSPRLQTFLEQQVI